MRGYLHGTMGPIDPNHPKFTLVMALERNEKGTIQMDPFLGACQQWFDNFEEKGV